MTKEEKRATKMFWVDMEMTGLDENTCQILEVAAVVTDLNLTVLDEYHCVVFQPKDFLDAMDKWCTDTHGKSGLTKEVEKGKSLATVEKELMVFGKKHFGEDKIVLAGNSISQDRKFIDRYTPLFSKMLHYRLIDVSSFKEVYRNKYGIEFQKKDTHRARSDIFESISELKHYLSFIKTS